jgi:hypothetical protein
MGRRLQPRVKGILPVRIWGTDEQGNAFAEHVCTIDISKKGASVAAVRAPLSPGSTVGLQYRNRQARFRVAWVAPAQTLGNNLGLECLQPGKELWPVDTPAEAADPYLLQEARLRPEQNSRPDRRANSRFPVSGAACVKTLNGEGGRWAKLGDLSLTGCYLHTADPVEVGRSLSLLVKIAGQEFEAVAIVRSSFSGIAMGLEFTFLSNTDRATLRSVLHRLKELDTDTVAG